MTDHIHEAALDTLADLIGYEINILMINLLADAVLAVVTPLIRAEAFQEAVEIVESAANQGVNPDLVLAVLRAHATPSGEGGDA